MLDFGNSITSNLWAIPILRAYQEGLVIFDIAGEIQQVEKPPLSSSKLPILGLRRNLVFAIQSFCEEKFTEFPFETRNLSVTGINF